MSSIWELGLLALTATLFSLLLLPLYIGKMTTGVALLSFGVFVVAAFLAVKRMFGMFTTRALFFHFCFIAITAVIFLSVMAVIVVDQTLTFKLVIYLLGSYVFSWLIGLITPGAPAGIGVREIMLIILMKGQISESNIVIAVALGRLVTTSGDFLFFFATTIYGRRFFLKVGV